MTKRCAWVLIGLTVLGSLAGCGGRASVVSGKVIKGDFGFILVVDSTDPRLNGEGLPGAMVRVNAGADRGATLLGESKSDKKGTISIPINDSTALLRPAEFSAELEGYGRTMGTMSIPPTNKRLLVILRPTGAGPTR